MKIINIGDKVKFLNDVGGGVVTEIIDKYLVKVLTDDDWEMPAMKNELLVIESSTNEEIEKPVFEKKLVEEKEIEEMLISKPEKKEDVSDVNIYFAITNKENKADNNSAGTGFELFFINDSTHQVFYNYILSLNAKVFSKEADILEPDTKILIDKFSQNEIPELLDMLFQIVIFKKGHYKPIVPFEKKLKLKGLKLIKQSSFESNDFFTEKAHLISLFQSKVEDDDFEINVEEITSAMSQKNKPDATYSSTNITKIFGDKLVVDLHIDELVDNCDDLQNEDILKIQLDEFNKSMQSVITENIKEAIFIHGKGQGILKTKIYTELKSNYKDFVYQDASFSEYSYGATLVMPK